MSETGTGGGAGGESVRATAKRVRKAVRRKGRKPVGFSKARAKLFLESLGMLCNVAAALRASGLAETTVYRRRRSDADFRVQWDEAIREGVARVEVELLNRALNGVEKPVWYGGKQVGSVREYSDATALAVLKRHGGTAGREPPPTDPDSTEDRRVELTKWLADMNIRMGGDG